MRLAALSVVALTALMLGTSPVVAQATADELTAMAQRVVDRSEALGEVWPGYWPPDQPFILYAPDTGAVFAGAASPQGPSFRPGPLEGATFSYVLNYPFGPPNTVLLEVDSPEDDLDTLFHEQFHDFQTDAFTWVGEGGGEYVDLALIADLGLFTAGVELERRVLADAVRAPEAQTRRALAQVYLALRRDREGRLHPSIIATERHREWTEGTAEYVGLQASTLVWNQPDDVLRGHLEGALRRELLTRPGGYVVNMFRWRAYGVGAAIAWLLDDIGVADWRTAVESGAPLDTLLEAAVGVATPDRRDEVRLTHDLDGLIREISPKMASVGAVSMDRDEFLASAPRRLVVELELPLAELAELQLSFHSAAMAPLSNGVIALPDATRVSAEWGGLALRVEGRSVLLDMPVLVENGRGVYRFSILLSDLGGLEALTPGALDAPVSVEIEGVTLTVPRGSVVEAQGEALVVSVTR
ncbi:hypothetical protein [Brevundimonas sp.]|uniref:hypothetical protein n=1 Tax=Brevundimonas sp. TaxID=1871086 RepID=UPI001D73C349|nr:hypothetical protein [Brevundimonas sp.]MBA4000482.1 hypothetical protein [Brevundimonas sp.]